MTEIFLIRHAINDWVKTGRLAGWTSGVHLNSDGQKQAQSLGKHLADARLAGIYSSPLERTMETAEAIAALPLDNLDLVVLSACDTGLGDVAGGEGVFAEAERLYLEELMATGDAGDHLAALPRENVGATSHFDIFPSVLWLMGYDTLDIEPDNNSWKKD